MKCEDKNQGDFYGMESWGLAEYQDIVKPEKIDYTDYFSDAEGTKSAELPGAQCTLEFIEIDGKTKVVNITRYDSPDYVKQVLEMGMEQGIKETWDRLAEHLEAVQ